MSAAQTPPYGRFVWYDLLTSVVAAATAFYARVAGWGTTSMDMGPGGTYTMFTSADVPLGGVTKLGPEMGPTPPHWMASVAVTDIDASAAHAKSLGGKVMMGPMEIPGVGRWAVISDPQGAMLGLYQSTTGQVPEDFNPKVGQFSWHELYTTDHRAALEFYGALFGWTKVQSMDMGPEMGGEYALYGHAGPGAPPGMSGIPYGGTMTMTAEMRAHLPPSGVYYVKVASADDAAKEIMAAGGKIVMGPMDVPGGDRIAQATDPQGAVVAVHSTPR